MDGTNYKEENVFPCTVSTATRTDGTTATRMDGTNYEVNVFPLTVSTATRMDANRMERLTRFEKLYRKTV